MINYIGVISREDAELLKSLAEEADRILEFGAGASTQVFSAYCKGAIDCVETVHEWVDKTTRNLEVLQIGRNVRFLCPRPFGRVFSEIGAYDLIFVDGADELRQSFALCSWVHLRAGGTMAFHDTRRGTPHGLSETSDVQNVCALIARCAPEIDSVILNAMDSNTTLIRKRAPLPYVDWQKTEGRTDAQMGIA